MKHIYPVVFLVLFSLAADAQNVINTIAGTGVAGYSGNGGQAINAQVNNPQGIVADGQGNYYFGDVFNHVVRKVNSLGIISVVAGTGVDGSAGDGGQATAAQLSWPVDVALDAQGNLYICDYMAQRIRKVNMTTGVITTVAGNGSSGFSGDGGQATLAQINFPTEITIDPSNNLYLTDQANDRVRKVNLTTGIITTFAGTGVAANGADGGLATATPINHPYGVAADPFGNIYISVYSNHTVRKVAAGTNIITTIAGNGSSGFWGDGGPGNQASINFPEGICTDSVGNVYITELNGCRVRRVNASDGYIYSIAGTGSPNYSGDGGDPLQAGMWPTSVEVKNGKIYIVDLNNRIRVIAPLSTHAPLYGTIASQMNILCHGVGLGTVTVEGVNGTPPYQYNINNGIYQNNNTFTGLAAGTYNINVKDAAGVIYPLTVVITEPPPVVVTTNATDTITLCQSDTIYLYVTSSAQNQCVWNTGAQGTYLMVTEPGVYTVSCRDANWCQGTSEGAVVEEGGNVFALFEYMQIDNYTVNFFNITQGATDYIWIFPDGTQDSTQNTQHDFAGEGTYNVVLVAYNACGSDTITVPCNVIKMPVQGLNEDGVAGYSIYPNPANDKVVIQIEPTRPLQGRLEVFNVYGSLVYAEGVNISSTYTKVLDVSAYAAGMYMVRLQSGAGVISRKLLVE